MIYETFLLTNQSFCFENFMGYHCSFHRATLFILLGTFFCSPKGIQFHHFYCSKTDANHKSRSEPKSNSTTESMLWSQSCQQQTCLHLVVICRAHVIDTVCVAAGWIGLMKSVTSWFYFWSYFFSFHMV